MSIIYLVLTSRLKSSDLPFEIGRVTLNSRYTWSCSSQGLPCHFCHQKCGELLPHLFTVTNNKLLEVYFLRHYLFHNMDLPVRKCDTLCCPDLKKKKSDRLICSFTKIDNCGKIKRRIKVVLSNEIKMIAIIVD